MSNCPICRLPDVTEVEPGIRIYDCPRCGRFERGERPFELGEKGVPWTWKGFLDRQIGPQDRRRANLSHKVRKRYSTGEGHVLVWTDELNRWGLDDPLPTPAELLDTLILWLGDNAPNYNDPVPADKRYLGAWLGLPIPNPDRPDQAVDWLLNEPATVRCATIPNRSAGQLALKLTWEGWERYTDLKRSETTSFMAFMAMKFGHADLDAALEHHFKPAVAATGFTLKRVTDGQGAGLIDDQMRVGLRTCRFVIADLTHASRGAYWEAGFGEGLGKPVIYTCRKDHWIAEGSHFDTNHLVTVVWDPATIDEAMSALKATIRATLPDVAKMVDQ